MRLLAVVFTFAVLPLGAETSLPPGSAICGDSTCVMNAATLENMNYVLHQQAEEIERMRRYGCGIHPV